MRLIIITGLSLLTYCVASNAEDKNVTKAPAPIIVADGPTWTYCINEAAGAHDCRLKPDPNKPCDNGYGIGGVAWTTKAAACAASKQSYACGGVAAQGC